MPPGSPSSNSASSGLPRGLLVTVTFVALVFRALAARPARRDPGPSLTRCWWASTLAPDGPTHCCGRHRRSGALRRRERSRRRCRRRCVTRRPRREPTDADRSSTGSGGPQWIRPSRATHGPLHCPCFGRQPRRKPPRPMRSSPGRGGDASSATGGPRGGPSNRAPVRESCRPKPSATVARSELGLHENGPSARCYIEGPGRRGGPRYGRVSPQDRGGTVQLSARPRGPPGAGCRVSRRPRPRFAGRGRCGQRMYAASVQVDGVGAWSGRRVRVDDALTERHTVAGSNAACG